MYFRIFIIAFMLISLTFGQSIYTSAAPDTPLKELLQQNLNLIEAERELKRLNQTKIQLQSEQAILESQVRSMESRLDEQRDQVANVIRAYYSGERPTLWMAIFMTDNWSELFFIYDLLEALYEHDRLVLQEYQKQYDATVKAKQDLESVQNTVVQTIAHYKAQMEQLRRLDQELQGRLAALPDADKVRLLMKQLEDDWLEKGLPAFTAFFNELALSMQQLSDIINPSNITRKGTTLRVEIADTDINTFLASKNRMFESVIFTFRDGNMWMEGRYQNIILTMIGYYEKVSDQKLEFVIDSLYYDGFELPDSTIKNLQNQFDLGFYPAKINPRVRVQSIQMKDRLLQIDFTLSLK